MKYNSMNMYLLKIYTKEYISKILGLFILSIMVAIASNNYLYKNIFYTADIYLKVDFIIQNYWLFTIPVVSYYLIFIDNSITYINIKYKFKYKTSFVWIESRIVSNLILTMIYTTIVFLVNLIVSKYCMDLK